MIGKELWQSMKALVECDNNIKNIEAEIATTEKNASHADNQIKILNKLIEDNQHQLTQGQKSVTLYELQAQTLEDNETNKRKQLSNIKNQKEYSALEKEIASIANARKDLDDLMLRTYHQADLDKNKITKEKEHNEQQAQQLAQDIEAQQLHLTSLKEKLNATINSRQILATKLPADWLSRYERMKNNVTDPIVPVLNNCCSSCFYSILLQDLSRLKKSGLLPCRNCYRLLYYDKEEETDTKKASY